MVALNNSGAFDILALLNAFAGLARVLGGFLAN
jgi:hypothetical protein